MIMTVPNTPTYVLDDDPSFEPFVGLATVVSLSPSIGDAIPGITMISDVTPVLSLFYLAMSVPCLT